MTVNKALVYKQTPVGLPKPGQDLKLEESEIDLEAPLNGGLLIKVCYFRIFLVILSDSS